MSQVCLVTASGEYVCGTGDWNGPKPGDPNTSDILLTSAPAFGGIDLNWSWPDTYPEAVAYTTIYRSTTDDFASAVVHRGAAAGNFFYDAVEISEVKTYFYWITITSIYGTRSEVIGPTSSTAKPRIAQMIDDLTQQINEGMLATALRTEIGRIELNALGITQEMIDRAAEDDALGVRVTSVGAHSGETRALLMEEVLARTSQGEAFVSTVNTLHAELNGNIAAIQVQTTALVNEVQALARQVTNLETQVGDDLAQVLQTMETKISIVDGKVVAIGAQWTAQVNVNGLIGGFSVYNDGQTVEAGFDVDRFWIGKDSTNKRKPFIVEGNVVYINEAAINSLTFSKLRDETGSFIVANGKIQAKYLAVDTLVANQAQSDNFVSGVSGWSLKADGTFEINGAGPGNLGRTRITPSTYIVFDQFNRMRVRLGLW